MSRLILYFVLIAQGGAFFCRLATHRHLMLRQKCYMEADSSLAVIPPKPETGIMRTQIITRSTPVRDLLAMGPGASFIKAYEGDKVLAAIDQMKRLRRTFVMVFDDNNELSGMFTERDFVIKLNDESTKSSIILKDVMTPRSDIISATPDFTIGECQNIFRDYQIRHIPIMNNDILVGALTISQVIRALKLDDERLDSYKLFGQTFQDIELQQKELANEELLGLGEEGKKQDIFRTLFVLSGSAVMIGLLQGDWIHGHETFSMIGVFILGYFGIVFENSVELNKAAVALLMATALWVIFAGSGATLGIPLSTTMGQLSEKLSEVSEIVYFLLGAMTIVEIIDAHQGFRLVTDSITSKKKRDLLWVIGFITFFMSAILDNLTTTIVVVSLVKKILPDIDDRKFFGSMVVIAANAGGAWTPIGDVTTTMLWINGQITTFPTMTSLFLPSLVSVILSVGVLAASIPEEEPVPPKIEDSLELAPRGKLVFGTGVLGLLSVPVFKSVTGLPPYLGMLAALGTLWFLTDVMHAGEDTDQLQATAALRKIDTSGVLFFLGILLSIGALDDAGLLSSLAQYLNDHIPYDSLIAAAIGFASAIIDNVPLVAATMGMYPTSEVATDSPLWQLIAYCAGTGGSLLIIGSAAGVALMGLEKVDFFWYFKKVSVAALVGYLGGIGVYLAQSQLHLFDISSAITTASAF